MFTSRLVAVGLVPFALVFSLPKDTDPREMVLASDGAVWTLGDYAGLQRTDPAGATREFLKHDELGGLVARPNGSIWVGAEQGTLQIEPSGRITRLSPEAPGRVVTPASGGGSWTAYDDEITRMNADGTSRDFHFHPPHDALDINGITQAPDGSVWFTENGFHKYWVWRMTAAGAFTHWRVPRSVGQPTRIAAGSDGAIWFTGRHAIGRIASSGQVTSFRVGGDAAPHDIVAGADGAMWFATDACLERVDGAGVMTTWPVAGALRLERIAAAPDGSFWLMDRVGNALQHVSPGAAAPCGAPTLTRAAGPASATLAFQRYDDDFFGDLHIRIARQGQELLNEAVPWLNGAEPRTSSNAVVVRDLDGDGEPEVMLTVNWSGTQCCSWSRIYRYDRARNTYVVYQHFWGYFGSEGVVRDLDGDGRPELRGEDDRFFARFAHEGWRPLRIWSYRHGKLHDVTSRFPRLVRADAAKLWASHLKDRKFAARWVLPAWMADQYRLGRQASADRVLEQAAARGELAHSYGYKPKHSKAFVRAVKAFLRQAGFSG